MSRFEQTYMGRGPSNVRAHLIGDLLVVRLNGVLTAAEKHLAMTLPVENGRELPKTSPVAADRIARPALESLVRDITGVKLRSLHHDISTVTGEQVVIFSLAEAPEVRATKKK